MFLNMFSCASGLCFKYIGIVSLKYSLAGFFFLLTLATTIYIDFTCNKNSDTRLILECNENEALARRQQFRTPLVPYLPAIGIYVNWFLMAHIGWIGMVLLVSYVLVGVILYEVVSLGKSHGNDRHYNSPHDTGVSGLQEALLSEGTNTDSP